METLETLFSSKARVAILRAFLFQPDMKLTVSDVAAVADVSAPTARSHAQDLAAIKLLTKTTTKDEESGKEIAAWQLNKKSSLRGPLHQIILQHQKVTPEKIARRIESAGDISLLVLSGIFSTATDRPVDLLIVGDEIDSSKLQRGLTRSENQLGIELRFTVLNRAEFSYRYNLYDKLIRNVLDYPHHVMIDTLSVTEG